MIKNVNKILIIGGPGSGKSTLARNLGKELNIPVCHLDSIHHLENWQIRDNQERDKIIFKKVSEPKWIMDGTYRSTLETRIQNSDCVIFLDYSTISKINESIILLKEYKTSLIHHVVTGKIDVRGEEI